MDYDEPGTFRDALKYSFQHALLLSFIGLATFSGFSLHALSAMLWNMFLIFAVIFLALFFAGILYLFLIRIRNVLSSKTKDIIFVAVPFFISAFIIVFYALWEGKNRGVALWLMGFLVVMVIASFVFGRIFTVKIEYKTLALDPVLLRRVSKSKDAQERLRFFRGELLDLLDRKSGFVVFPAGKHLVQYAASDGKLLFSVPSGVLKADSSSRLTALVGEDIKVKTGNCEAWIGSDVDAASGLTELVFREVFRLPEDYKIGRMGKE